MLINAANMADLFRTYSTAFGAGQTSAQGRVGQNGILLSELALVIPSTGGSVNHAWLEQIRAMREWIGDRLISNLKIGNLTVVNRKFENTISVGRDAIEDDQYGVFAPLMTMMGDDAEALWLRLCIDAMIANGNWADGNPFFCSARVLGASTFTNAVTTALSATAFEAGMSAMGGFTLFGGEPAEVTPVYLLCGPSLEATAKRIVEAEMVSDGAVSVSNINKGRVTLRTSTRITGNTWYLVGKKNQLGPVAVQQRKKGVLTRMDRETDENVFMQGNFLYGTEARGEAFLTLPFLAYAGGLDSVAAFA